MYRYIDRKNNFDAKFYKIKQRKLAKFFSFIKEYESLFVYLSN